MFSPDVIIINVFDLPGAYKPRENSHTDTRQEAPTLTVNHSSPILPKQPNYRPTVRRRRQTHLLSHLCPTLSLRPPRPPIFN